MSSKQYFDEVAQQWDDMREVFFSEAVREKAITIAGVQPGKLAADIGAGSGFITEGLIQRGLRVIAVDQSEAMLAEMRKRLVGFDDIDCRVGEAESLRQLGRLRIIRETPSSPFEGYEMLFSRFAATDHVRRSPFDTSLNALRAAVLNLLAYLALQTQDISHHISVLMVWSI